MNKVYNPDVLTCLANLSNDEVFTPPQLANDILDLLPEQIWSDPNATFLDPVCKSGIFLREITKRLMLGLKGQIPDQQARINHILSKQVYGIAITEMTALLSRRSLYCSKKADGKYSVCNSFKSSDGNILCERVEHTWENGRCAFCGANQERYDRGDDLESHAYQFIHTNNPEEIFHMKFDVIVGNPPYQLSDGGHGKSASPIYNKFVQQAKKLNPTYLTMIIPARWFAGGKGLDTFRAEMINDEQIRKLVVFNDAQECFPGVDIAGGVCYFLWQKDTKGPCTVVNVSNDRSITSIRELNEFTTLIRDSAAITILRKIQSKNEPNMSVKVSSAKPFGLRTYERPYESGDIFLKWHGGLGPYRRENVPAGQEMIDLWKVITSKVSYDHGGQSDKNGMRRVFSILDIIPPGTICTETYLVVGAFKSERNARNLLGYMRTKFVRFLVAQLSFSQDIFKDKFMFVPDLDPNESWSDRKLYSRYELDQEEVAFIEATIRPMENENGN